jgi:hypothetical protein
MEEELLNWMEEGYTRKGKRQQSGLNRSRNQRNQGGLK